MAKCIPCMTPDMKVLIESQFDVADILKDIPDCPPGTLMDMCAGGGSRSGHGKSQYQVFVSECLKGSKESGKPITERMKGCALQWNQSKKGSSPSQTDQSQPS